MTRPRQRHCRRSPGRLRRRRQVRPRRTAEAGTWPQAGRHRVLLRRRTGLAAAGLRRAKAVGGRAVLRPFTGRSGLRRVEECRRPGLRRSRPAGHIIGACRESRTGQGRLVNELVVEPDADHAFFNDTGARYSPVAAADAWKRLQKPGWFVTSPEPAAELTESSGNIVPGGLFPRIGEDRRGFIHFDEPTRLAGRFDVENAVRSLTRAACCMLWVTITIVKSRLSSVMRVLDGQRGRRVQNRAGFVHQQDVGPYGDGAGNAQPLLLTARQPAAGLAESVLHLVPQVGPRSERSAVSSSTARLRTPCSLKPATTLSRIDMVGNGFGR